MGKSFEQVNSTERKLIVNMKEAGLTWAKIQEITERSSKTIDKVLRDAKKPLSTGMTAVKKQSAAKASNNNKTLLSVLDNPRLPTRGSLTLASFKALVLAMDTLQKAAKGRKEVTMAMVKEKARVTASARVCHEAFRANGIWFAKLKDRQILQPGDDDLRLTWSNAKMSRSRESWVERPHAIIDNKNWEAFVDGKGREHAARRSCRGAYQLRGAAPQPWLVKPKRHIKYPTKSVTVTAAVIKGKIRMWRYVDGRFNGKEAASMYKDLSKVLGRTLPDVRANSRTKFVVLEDNDPCFKSSSAKKVKAVMGMVTDDLPPRSPDLNPLDYSLWRAIETRMRKQEASFKEGFKETTNAWKMRLRKTAMNLPKSVVENTVMDMKDRVGRCADAAGGLFE